MTDLITINPAELPEIHFEDFLRKTAPPDKKRKFQKPAEKVFKHAREIWRPRGLLRQLSLDGIQDGAVTISSSEKSGLTLATGFSSRFLTPACKVMLGVYTIGDKVRQAGIKAASEQCHLESYLYDLAGLTVLEQTGNAVNRIVEKIAAKKKWGVGPFLSPGSVHGWDLAEQKKLCSLLPLHEIGVTVTDSAVLTPFHSVSFIIGMGEGYTSKTVGSTCMV
jgi:hypothetical protein